MTEVWNGRPPAPLGQVEGWHWLKNKGSDQKPFPVRWYGEKYCDAPTEWRWDAGDESDGCPDDFAHYFEYVTACPTPDQIAANVVESEQKEQAELGSCDPHTSPPSQVTFTLTYKGKTYGATLALAQDTPAELRTSTNLVVRELAQTADAIAMDDGSR